MKAKTIRPMRPTHTNIICAILFDNLLYDASAFQSLYFFPKFRLFHHTARILLGYRPTLYTHRIALSNYC